MRELKVPWLWVAVATAVAAAAWVMNFRLQQGPSLANDAHAYFYPKMLYALASLRDGGRGLLWNPFQNCGEPFFGMSQTGLLYPPYLLFLILDPDRALRGVLLVHLAIGGIGSFLLCRELGARPLAALAGGLAFEMGNAMVGLTISSPTHGAPYAWMPAALWCCERALRTLEVRRAAVLAVVLAIAILPGMPQTVFFIYEVILLRFVWEAVVTRGRDAWGLARTALIGLGLPPLLAAVQLFPELEVARQSLRSGSLTMNELTLFGMVDASLFQRQLLTRNIGQPFLPVACMVALTALLAPATRRSALFYGTAGLLFFALSFGPGTPVFDLYSHLPGGAAFRDPNRFGWVTSFALAVMTGLGCEALMELWRARRRSGAAIALMVVPLVLLWLAAFSAPEAMRREYEEAWHLSLAPSQLVFSAWERAAALLALAAALAGFLVPRLAPWAGAALLAAVGVQVLASPEWTSMVSLYPSAPPVWETQPMLAPLAASLSAQDRVYLVHEHPAATEFAFMAKTASLLRIPDILDYEPLVSRRYADFAAMLRAGVHARGLADVLRRGPEPTASFRRRLLDLSAVRYVVAAPRLAAAVEAIDPPLPALGGGGELRLFENPNRLPRAYYVARVEVVPDAEALLDRLADGSDDLRQVALVEEPPASGFGGASTPSAADAVRFARNDPEHVVLDVDAPAPGFVILSDQYFPGWTATVNGSAAPIQRANYAFRLVEVPAGRSTVEFRYSPRSLWLGAGASALGLAVATVLLIRRPRRPVRRAAASAAAPPRGHRTAPARRGR